MAFKDRLVIVERDYRFRIGWYLADEGDIGAVLGEGRRYTARNLKAARGADREHILAELAAAKTSGVERHAGFYWHTRADATAALRSINLALKMDGGAPWPEWAQKAHAAGWKAPKGWKP